MELSVALAMEGARSHSVDLSETVADRPWFETTPYPETLSASGLPSRVALSGVDRNGVVFAALERGLVLGAGERAVVRLACGVAADTAAALALASDATERDPVQASTSAWSEWFGSVPSFTCSDPWLETYYWYRWYGLRLNRIAPALGNYVHPAVAEGIDYFRVPISYSAQCHMLETRWMHDPELARGSLLNFVDNQRADGSFPNHIHAEFVAPEGIYHADWGQRTLDVHDVHPDAGFLRRAYPALARYAEYFYRTRDAQASGLYDHVNQWESGQEYMSRYVWVDPAGDAWRPMARRLKGLDATLYIYRLEAALARMSAILGLGEEERWTARAQTTRTAILAHCWDPDAQAFMDLSPELERSGLVFATSFYPFFTDLIGEEHLPSIDRYLLSEDHFWTPFPVPASPRSDPHYSATPAWKGKRTNCPWNGRTWPMTNSHVAEALACASQLRPDLRATTATFIHAFVRMMFHDRDPARPNAFEHYNPDTGHPSAYRGIDDYQHSWVVDLIVKYVAGVRPVPGGVRVDPFPFGLDAFALADVRVRGRRIDVDYDATGFRVRLDGELVHASETIEAVDLQIPEA